MKKGKARLGYKDGSGPDLITIDDNAVLAIRWGCSCCKNGADSVDDLTDEEREIAAIVVAALNKQKAAKRGSK
jgi:hypothetical protein